MSLVSADSKELTRSCFESVARKELSWGKVAKGIPPSCGDKGVRRTESSDAQHRECLDGGEMGRGDFR